MEFRHQGLSLELTILDINRIILHEEVHHDILKELCQCIIKQGVFSQPVMVDKKSFVVLDGMHRVTALKDLNARRVPVCFIDYSNPAIILGAWYRTLKTQQSFDEIIVAINEAGIRSRPIDFEDATNELKERKASAVLIGDKRAFLINPIFRSIEEAYKIINKIEKTLVNRGYQLAFETETDALNKFEAGLVDAVLMTPLIKKNEVIDVAKSGRVFTPKATRHIIPARPINILIPLTLLRDEAISLEEADSWLVNHLKKKRLTFMPPKSFIGGRRYDEETCLFED